MPFVTTTGKAFGMKQQQQQQQQLLAAADDPHRNEAENANEQENMESAAMKVKNNNSTYTAIARTTRSNQKEEKEEALPMLNLRNITETETTTTMTESSNSIYITPETTNTVPDLFTTRTQEWHTAVTPTHQEAATFLVSADDEDEPLPALPTVVVTTNTINTANTDGTSIAISFPQENPSIISRAPMPTPRVVPKEDNVQEVQVDVKDEVDENEDDNHINSNSIAPALPAATSRQLFSAAAAEHGGNESTAFMQHEQQIEQQQYQQQQQQRLKSASSTLEAPTISRNPSSAGKHEKKIGHRRVDEAGEVTYKRIKSKQIMGSIQLGIQHSVGSLASKPKRDLLMNDFWEMETISFPSDGSQITPAHHFTDFQIKVYAPIAFRYFRDLFGIQPDDFLLSMCKDALRQLSNPGASGSLFYLTSDDEFIIKTVQKKECEFLQKLLPGYYMNLSQNPRTLLPKFFGLWCFHYNSKNVRLAAMNNLLPSDIKMHEKYDLKGSTFRRKASKAERQKASPTFKDLDFMDRHPGGIFLEADTYKALINTIQRDCMVLESFQIMDYSMLVGVHNLDLAAREKREDAIKNARAKLQRHEEIREMEEPPDFLTDTDGAIGGGYSTEIGLNRTRSMNRPRLVAHSTAMESITADVDAPLDENEDVPVGGIPARSENDERLLLFIGIIDILQSYRLEKKIEHTFKSILYNGDTVSVCRPSFYAQRFQNFMAKTVFKKTPTFPLKHSPSKRKTSTTTMLRTPMRTPSHSSAAAMRPTNLTGSSTPPPAFDDISEEDLTATSSTATAALSRQTASANSKRLMQQQSYASSVLSNPRSRSRMSSTTDDYSDEEFIASSGGGGGVGGGGGGGGTSIIRSPIITRYKPVVSPRLSRTRVQVTTVGGGGTPTTNDDETTTSTPIKITPVRSEQQILVESVNGKQTSDADGPRYTTNLVVNDVAR